MEFNNIVLWGTGIIGHRYYNILKKMGITPLMFIDNNIKKQDTCINGIHVYSPIVLKKHSDYIILIACKASDDIYNQAIKLGISSNNIYKVQESMWLIMLHAIERDAWSIRDKYNGKINKNSIAFDLQNGAALGGVETWVLEQGTKLSKNGYDITCLIGNDDNTQLTIPTDFTVVHVNKTEKIEKIIEENIINLETHHYGVVVSNFASTNMMCNCYYKSLNSNVKHIMVIHNDEIHYFQLTLLMQEYIDYCLVISERIKEKLIKGGFSKDKIVMMNWNIDVSNNYREYNCNDIIKIGYAGRVASIQKRLDYIPRIIDELEQAGINYVFEIAGLGDYYNELFKYVKQNNLDNKVVLLGMLDKRKMRDFWSRQDIYFSCSDWEGHSISQCEGIACGAVPVVTDVSGASDDIEDGVTGYIVPIGNWEMLADKIVYLNQHRDMLKSMSDAGMDRMRERNKLYKDNVLEELCH